MIFYNLSDVRHAAVGYLQSVSIEQLVVCIVNETNTYIGLTEGTFKKRFTSHKSTFSNEKLRLSSELSKKIWSLKDDGKQYNITWDIVKRTSPRKAGKNTCDLCNTEKLAIIQEIRRKNTHLLNKRSEIVSKCRHVNKFLLKSF